MQPLMPTTTPQTIIRRAPLNIHTPRLQLHTKEPTNPNPTRTATTHRTQSTRTTGRAGITETLGTGVTTGTIVNTLTGGEATGPGCGGGAEATVTVGVGSSGAHRAGYCLQNASNGVRPRNDQLAPCNGRESPVTLTSNVL